MEDSKTTLLLLRQVRLFQTLPEAELAQLAPNLRTRQLDAAEVLFRENEVGDRLSIIIDGQVEIIKAMGLPDERILAVLGQGEMMGDMSLVLENQRHTASARALSDTKILEMTRENFANLLGRSSQLALRIMQEMSDRLRHSEETTIHELREKNHQLINAFNMLSKAQEQLVQKEKIEHELKMARQIQQNYLPKEVPVLPGWRLAAYWQPAHEVSGDFYDFISLPNNLLGLLIGDVTGKGVPAALVMATTRSVLRAVALSKSDGDQISPGTLLEKINNTLCADMPQNMFVTCLFAILDPQTGRLCFSNAGHPLPYLRTAQGVMQPKATGMPLGLIPDMHYDEREIILGQGECLLMYSDGLVEAHNAHGEMFSFARLQGLMAGCEYGPELISMLMEQLAGFVGDANEQEDDVTLVSLERA